MTRLLIIILILFKGIAINSQLRSNINWVSDMEFLKQELPEKHIDLFFHFPKDDFNLGLDKLIQDTQDLDDYEILNRLLQHIAKIGDSHTSIDYSRFRKANIILPFSLYWFSDGLYITHVRLGYEQLLGNRIISINDFGIGHVVDSLSTLIAIDNQASVRNRIPRMIGFVPHLEYFGFSENDTICIKLQDTNGIESNIFINQSELKGDDIVTYKPDSMAYCWINRNKFFAETYFEKDSIYYIQYNRCWSKELEWIRGSRKRAKGLPSFLKFQKQVFNIIEQKPIKKTIFDLRFNPGGASPQGTRMIKRLASHKQINQKGRLFVITGMRTYSASIDHVVDFEKHTHAIFVGEETSGKPNAYGEIKNILLPSSGLRISYSTKYFRKREQETDSFYPDVKIETSFQDYNNGIDPVFEFIKTMK